jgi:hypothetical protein
LARFARIGRLGHQSSDNYQKGFTMIGKPRGGSVLGALATLALAGGLAACGGTSASSTTTATAAASASSAAPIGAKSSGATPSTASTIGGVASPGTKLSVGQTAKVTYNPVAATRGGGSSTLLVTVKSFKKASLSDFNGIQLDASQKASTPYFVKVHVANLGPHSIDVDGTAAAIEGVDSTGSGQQSVTFIGTFPPCPDMASTTPLGPGHSYDDCLTFLVPGGITKVSYNGTTDYIDSPVTWLPPAPN